MPWLWLAIALVLAGAAAVLFLHDLRQDPSLQFTPAPVEPVPVPLPERS